MFELCASVRVFLQTDLQPGIEIDRAQVVAVDGVSAGVSSLVVEQLDADDELVEGREVAEISGLRDEPTRVRVQLLRANEIVAEEQVLVQLGEQATAVTVRITRDCVGVSCNEQGSELCLNGQCVSEQCSPENPDACPDGCSNSDDCPTGSGCTVARCVDRACLLDVQPDGCGAGQWCDPNEGCSPLPTAGVEPGDLGERTSDPLVLYTFHENEGSAVHDVSGNEPPLDLRIRDDSEGSAQWLESGLSLNVRGSSIVEHAASPDSARIRDAIQSSKALSLEAWLTPREAYQGGPARIVSFENLLTEDSFLLGHGDCRAGTPRERICARVSSVRPSTVDGRLFANTSIEFDTGRVHVVVVAVLEQPGAEILLYRDGNEVDRRAVEDDMIDISGWATDDAVLVGNRADGGRPWFGELHLVAIYGSALTASEVRANFEAGPFFNR